MSLTLVEQDDLQQAHEPANGDFTKRVRAALRLHCVGVASGVLTTATVTEAHPEGELLPYPERNRQKAALLLNDPAYLARSAATMRVALLAGPDGAALLDAPDAAVQAAVAQFADLAVALGL